jgi:hypothetical protein
MISFLRKSVQVNTVCTKMQWYLMFKVVCSNGFSSALGRTSRKKIPSELWQLFLRPRWDCYPVIKTGHDETTETCVFLRVQCLLLSVCVWQNRIVLTHFNVNSNVTKIRPVAVVLFQADSRQTERHGEASSPLPSSLCKSAEKWNLYLLGRRVNLCALG